PHLIERLFDLRPPPDAPFHLRAVLPDGDRRLVGRQTLSECGREFLSVPARVRQEHTRTGGERHWHHLLVSGRCRLGVSQQSDRILGGCRTITALEKPGSSASIPVARSNSAVARSCGSCRAAAPTATFHAWCRRMSPARRDSATACARTTENWTPLASE